MILFGDLETYCDAPLKHGTYQYAEKCEIMLFTYAIDDGPVLVWDLTTGKIMPDDLYAGLREADEIVFQNSMFDRSVFRLSKSSPIVMRLVGDQVERWRDTMVQALTHSLPGGLEKLGDVLKVEQDKRKLKVGKELIRLFCIPPAKNLKRGRATRETHPVEWAQFVEYAVMDTHAMREIHRKCPKWNYRGDELALWHLDQRINDRGVCVDLELATTAIGAVKKEQARLKDVGQEMTAGWVESLTKRDKLLEYILMEHGIDLPNLQKDTLERRIDDPDLPIELRDLLAARLMATTSSTSKYNAVVRGVSRDGRLRGLLQFAGASRTARWAGRLFQPQNLMRPDMSQEEIDAGIEAIKVGCADLLYDNVMRVCANAMRGVIVAPPGKKLVVGDLANIEGRMAAWLAGEAWKLDAFREYDAGTGPDLYKVAYAKAFNILVTAVTKPMRQIGKVMELMLQYEGGVGAFITGAATYGIDLDAMAEAALPNIPADVLQESVEFYAWAVRQKRTTFGLARDTFIACDALKRLWRYAHPAIANTWPALKAAVIEAINQPGGWITQGRFWRNGDNVVVPIKTPVRRDGAWLKIQLPSGRFLCYPSPQVDDKGQISYLGVNQYSRQWGRIKTYGGKLFENCIAEETPVLTRRGWVPIQSVTYTDTVWDGVEWVQHSGCIYKGKQLVICVYQTIMTPDHLVLTKKGWRHASSCEGLDRLPCRLPDGYALPRIGWQEVDMGSAVSLRQDGAAAGGGVGEAEQAGYPFLLRLHESRVDRQEQHETRDVRTPGVLGVAVDERSLSAPNTPRLGRLRRSWHQGVRRLGSLVRRLLGRHGADIPTRLYARTQRELEGICSGQLRMAHAAGAGEQHSPHCVHRHAERPDAFDRSSGVLRHKEEHAGLQTRQRLAGQRSLEHPAGLPQSAVYDLIDCGPRNRFVVLGADGQPLIVHNCTQAAARDVLAANMQAIEDDGFEIVLTVHDEIISEAPDTPDYDVDRLCSHIATVPEWAEGLPLAAAGFEGYRYRKE